MAFSKHKSLFIQFLYSHLFVYIIKTKTSDHLLLLFNQKHILVPYDKKIRKTTPFMINFYPL